MFFASSALFFVNSGHCTRYITLLESRHVSSRSNFVSILSKG